MANVKKTVADALNTITSTSPSDLVKKGIVVARGFLMTENEVMDLIEETIRDDHRLTIEGVAKIVTVKMVFIYGDKKTKEWTETMVKLLVKNYVFLHNKYLRNKVVDYKHCKIRIVNGKVQHAFRVNTTAGSKYLGAVILSQVVRLIPFVGPFIAKKMVKGSLSSWVMTALRTLGKFSATDSDVEARAYVVYMLNKHPEYQGKLNTAITRYNKDARMMR